MMRRKNRKVEQSVPVAEELAALDREVAKAKRERPSVERLGKELRRHLKDDRIGDRLYLQMIQNRR